jgi:hypothetical protein
MRGSLIEGAHLFIGQEVILPELALSLAVYMLVSACHLCDDAVASDL